MSFWDLLYSKIVDARKNLYLSGIFKSYKMPVKVLSVGNLTFGGTGKSPVISFLLNKYSDKNIAVLSRGYGRKTKGFYKVEADGLNSASLFGDEPVMLAEKHKNINFYVCEDRVAGIQEILKEENPEWIFLDDGFQHLRVKRDLNILVIDATESLSNYHFPPFGRLRNKTQDIHDANIVMLSKVNMVDLKKIAAIEAFFEYKDFIKLESKIINIKNDKNNTILKPCEVVLVSGIAKPKNFKNNVEELGFKVIKHFEFKDHYNYSTLDIEKIKLQFPKYPIIVTEKDYAKLKQFDINNLFVSQLNFKEISTLEKLNVYFS